MKKPLKRVLVTRTRLFRLQLVVEAARLVAQGITRAPKGSANHALLNALNLLDGGR